MKVILYEFKENNWVNHSENQDNDFAPTLVLVFSSKKMLLQPNIYESLKLKFPGSEIAMCSTAGEILKQEVSDNKLIATAIQFQDTLVQTTSVNVNSFKSTKDAAIALTKQLPKENLKYVLVLSDGSKVNGTQLIKILNIGFGNKVLITGGLAGDQNNFLSTLVGLNNKPEEGEIAAIGLYGDNIKVTHGTCGGWDTFGLEKRVTKSNDNVLIELEDKNALDIYKAYLGEDSKNLPGSALLYPLSLTVPNANEPVVRTILSINEEEKTMTFAGEIPVGSTVRFMKANLDKIVLAAGEAAANTKFKGLQPAFSLLISCVGRKIILGEKVEQEIVEVSKVYEHKTLLSGFYSYGELSPFNDGGTCQLHNQTMTITSFYENIN